MKEHINVDFPYEEIRTESGDYFDSVSELLKQGYAKTQIWSVVEGDSFEDGIDYVIVTGPSHHYVNRYGYFATKEHHDEDTYYVEEIILDK